MKGIIVIIVLMLLVGCNTLEPQDDYCEIAFAYDVNEPLPDAIRKDRIGCACATKDVMAGKVISGWVLKPIDTHCRRIRGFHPNQWADPIDKHLQAEVAKKLERARKKKR